jgi:hypothetical protein
MRRSLASVAAVSCLFLAAGCGQDDPSAAGEPSSAKPSASTGESADGSAPSGSAPSGSAASGPAQRTAITFDGASVSPSGKRVEVAAGEPVELVVTADAPGEIHVHSSPEQELEYDAGTTTLELTIDQPGVVDVESHDLEKTIVQLEVR